MQVEWRWWWWKHRRRSIVVDDPAPHHHFHQLPCLASYLLLFFGLYISEASADDANWASNSSDGIARAGGRVAASASSSSSSSSSSHVIVATVATAAAAAAATAALLVAMRYHRRRISKGEIIGEYERFAEPFLKISPAGRVEEFERFPQYVARQLGLGSLNECPSLGKLASDYLVKAKGCEDQIYSFFSGSGVNPDDAESASQKLIDELDKCILGYLAFHWDHAPTVINQVLSEDGKPKKKLRHMVMEATRAIRFERITKDLKVTRMFSTLWEEMKVIGSVHGGSGSGAKDRCTEVMVPAARGERSPVLMLMGGGMGAGKSTVLKDILTEPFWTATEPVVVEADQFKETDVIYRALSSRGHHNDMLQTAELVHQSSTDAASSLLVTALNEGRDVIMDGTLSWEPFVRQTIEMARAVHKHRYRMGPGYKKGVDGEPDTEEYWQQVDGEEGQVDCENGFQERKPYRIELVGVVCDAYMAVVRGIRRAIMVKRAVRVKSQLRSHKMFAYNFSRYCEIVDCARLYSTNSIGAPPKLIAWKLVSSRLLVDSAEIHCLQKLASLNENADSIHQLYPPDDDEDDASKQLPRLHSIWDDIVVSPNRVALQAELKAALLKVESNANISMVS